MAGLLFQQDCLPDGKLRCTEGCRPGATPLSEVDDCNVYDGNSLHKSGLRRLHTEQCVTGRDEQSVSALTLFATMQQVLDMHAPRAPGGGHASDAHDDVDAVGVDVDADACSEASSAEVMQMPTSSVV